MIRASRTPSCSGAQRTCSSATSGCCRCKKRTRTTFVAVEGRTRVLHLTGRHDAIASHHRHSDRPASELIVRPPEGFGVAKARLFPIQGYDYEAGVCADGRQVIMGLLCPELV